MLLQRWWWMALGDKPFPCQQKDSTEQPLHSPAGLALSLSPTIELNGPQITQLFLYTSLPWQTKGLLWGGTETIGTYYVCDLLKPFTVMDLR